ncbi:hypothetical protein BDA99DRAFT_511408 [Phascolomyces articulosus]|uniref:Crossover junction endonuclease MUS81 n=1 Tax=Phascolomyces articulosus TaxID=60185 RepID=A0AAD5PDK1_9FUNG|nr:hypothetical protein BDA99DRAFT_511408 [Phascolomyces articulosus]
MGNLVRKEARRRAVQVFQSRHKFHNAPPPYAAAHTSFLLVIVIFFIITLMVRSNAQCGNPLWRDWMKEWAEEEQAKQSKLHYTYMKAYNSLNKCQQEFTHPVETKQLHGIGDTIAKRLEKKLKQYCDDNGIPMPQKPTGGKRTVYMSEITDDISTQRKRPRPRTYVPKYRTGSYAILLALLEHREVNNHTKVAKDQIIRLAEPHCDASFDRAEATFKNYTAWSSIKMLEEKSYVYKRGSPPTYTLTDTGYEMALQLKTAAANNGAGSSSSQRRQQNRQYDGDDNSDMGGVEEEVDLSLYVTNPEQYRRPMGLPASNNSSQQGPSSSTSRQNVYDNDSGGEEVDLSLYVTNPEQYRRSMGLSTSSNFSSQQRPSPAPSSSWQNTNRQNVYDNDSRGEEVDLSLYVTNPELYRRSIAATPTSSTTTNNNNRNSFQQQSSQSDEILEYYRRQNAIRRGEVYDDNSNRNEEDVDLSLYVTNPEQYRLANSSQKRACSTSSSQKNTNSTGHQNSQSNRNMSYNDDDPLVDLSLYVTNPAKYRAEMASSAPLNNNASSTQISLVDDDIDLYSRSSIVENEVFTRYQSSPPRQTFNSSQSTRRPIDFADLDDDVIALDSPASQTVPPSPLPGSSQPFPCSLPDPDDISLPESEFGSQNVFQYTYLNTSNKPVRHISQASVDIRDQQLFYKIRFSSGQYAHPRTDKLRDVKQDVDNTYMGYMAESDAAIVCPGLPETPLIPLNREEEEDFWPSLEAPDNSNPSTPFDSQTVSNSQLSVGASQMDTFIEYTPDSYEIVLILDTREIKLKTNRDYFLEQLTAKGVRVVKRALELGDMIWVAQKKGSKSQRDELFLDYIVERKRMDDLAASIKDGRFDEQKYRLRNAGAQKVFYIIEEYNKEEAMNFGVQAIQTAMSSTQTVDGFFLKRTPTISDTIDYLVTLTKLIEQIYDNVTLYRIPDHLINRNDYVEQKKRYGDHHLITYTMYSGLNSKTDTLTLKDLYLRMLMTIRGVSAEKAQSLIKIYPTPIQLLQAYDFKSDQEGKDLAKEMTKNSIGNRRRWGTQLSEKLWEIWGQRQ